MISIARSEPRYSVGGVQNLHLASLTCVFFSMIQNLEPDFFWNHQQKKIQTDSERETPKKHRYFMVLPSQFSRRPIKHFCGSLISWTNLQLRGPRHIIGPPFGWEHGVMGRWTHPNGEGDILLLKQVRSPKVIRFETSQSLEDDGFSKC